MAALQQQNIRRNFSNYSYNIIHFPPVQQHAQYAPHIFANFLLNTQLQFSDFVCVACVVKLATLLLDIFLHFLLADQF